MPESDYVARRNPQRFIEEFSHADTADHHDTYLFLISFPSLFLVIHFFLIILRYVSQATEYSESREETPVYSSVAVKGKGKRKENQQREGIRAQIRQKFRVRETG